MKAGQVSRMSSPSNFYGRVAEVSFVHSGSVIAVYLFLAACSLLLALNSLTFDTDPGKMISQELPFRKDFIAFKSAFPMLDNTFLIVVEADNAKDAEKTGQSLVQSLRKKPELFHEVFAPELDDFLQRNGFLFLPLKQLTGMTREILRIQPMINMIAAQPDLPGLANLIGSAVASVKPDAEPEKLIRLVNLTDKTMQAWVKNQSLPLDWSEIVIGNIGHKPGRFSITVKPVIDFSLLDPAAVPLAEINKIINDLKTAGNGKVKILLTGEAALNSQELSSIMKGTLRAGIVSLILVGMIIWFGMPQTHLVIPALILLLLGFPLNIGFAALTTGSLNMISVVFVVLFIGLGVDYAVHLTLRYWEKRVSGQGRLSAIISAAEDIGPALALCTLTTSLAFLTFSFTDFVGMAQLGIIAGGGIIVAFIASITLVPAVLARIPEKVFSLKTKNPSGLRRGIPAWRKIRFFLTVITLCAALTALFFIPDVYFDGDPIHLKDQASSTVIAYKNVMRNEPGEINAAQIISPDPDTAQATARRLEKLDVVHSVRWLGSFIPDHQEEKMRLFHQLKGIIAGTVNFQEDVSDEAGKAALVKLEKRLKNLEHSFRKSVTLHTDVDNLRATISLVNRKAATGKPLSSLKQDVFSLLPNLLRQLAIMSDAIPISFLNMDSRITRRYVNSNNFWRLEVIPAKDLAKKGDLRAFVSDVRAISPHATGAPVEIIGAADVVSSAMGKATIMAILFVLVILALVFRSIKEIILVVLPLVLAGLLLLGCTVLFKVPFNFANVIVLPLLLGLGIDSAIHYVLRAKEEHGRRNIIFTTTPRAIILSSLTTIGSFGTLWLSPHNGISSMGELLVISLCITLWCMLVVLPQLIAWTKVHRLPSTNGNRLK